MASFQGSLRACCVQLADHFYYGVLYLNHAVPHHSFDRVIYRLIKHVSVVLFFKIKRTKEGDGDARAAHDPADRASGGHALAPARMR